MKQSIVFAIFIVGIALLLFGIGWSTYNYLSVFSLTYELSAFGKLKLYWASSLCTFGGGVIAYISPKFMGYR